METKSLSEILKLFETEPFNFHKEETIAALRQMAYLLRSTSVPHADNLENDERYLALSQKVNDYMSELDGKSNFFVLIANL